MSGVCNICCQLSEFLSMFILVHLTDIPKLEKANMLLLSKEMTDRDRSMKTQLLFKPKVEKLSGERIWKENGFFKDVRAELNLEKVNIPENCLFYANQGFLSTVKSGEIAMYLHNFIIGQLIIAANQPKDISTYSCEKNEVKLMSCVYDLESGDFKGIREQVAFIVLRGDADEIFFSYGYDKQKSKLLYSYSKQQIPDAFVSVAFKKHFHEIMNEGKSETMSSLFYFLPSISDRKEGINQHKNNTSLSPIDITSEFIESFSLQNAVFRPDLLNSSDEKVREPQTERLYGLFKHIAKVSNQNLERNIAYLNLSQNRSTNDMEWTNSKFDSSKFNFTY